MFCIFLVQSGTPAAVHWTTGMTSEHRKAGEKKFPPSLLLSLSQSLLLSREILSCAIHDLPVDGLLLVRCPMHGLEQLDYLSSVAFLQK